MNLNKAIIIGRITKEPELKALPTGTKVCSFSVATNEVFKTKDGEKKESTEFHNVVVFGNMAENVAKYMGKGNEIYIEGKITTRSWEDKTTKEKKYRTEIVAQNIQFGAKPKSAGETRTEKEDRGVDTDAEIETEVTDDIDPSNIPF